MLSLHFISLHIDYGFPFYSIAFKLENLFENDLENKNEA